MPSRARSPSCSASPTRISGSCGPGSRWASCCRCRCSWSASPWWRGASLDRGAQALSALEAAMIGEIRRAGPISIARFMDLALAHPTLGYYAGHDPLGAAGDFVTAPEISQVFGEIVGLWLARAWSDLGRPDPCLLVELGPGRGTLMADLLRAAAQVPGFRAALRLHLVETSERLRNLQRRH